MRKSEITFIDTCFNVKCYLRVDSYELHHYEDGDYADFKVTLINDPKNLLSVVGNHECRFLADDEFIRVRVFENFVE